MVMKWDDGRFYWAGDREAAADGDVPAGECWVLVADRSWSLGEVDGDSVVGAGAGGLAAVTVGIAVDWGTDEGFTLGGVDGLASLADGADGAKLRWMINVVIRN